MIRQKTLLVTGLGLCLLACVALLNLYVYYISLIGTFSVSPVSERSLLAYPPIGLFHVGDINCERLFKGHSSELFKADQLMLKYDYAYHANLAEGYQRASTTCADFKQQRGYIIHGQSQEEADFPIAYSIVVYEDITRVERLLRAIYRPQNYYCIHVDTKASILFQWTILNITACFDNVFLSSTSVNVAWGHYSVLKADLICIEDLLKYKWKYFINLTGHEFPLKTNMQIVKILKSYKGANDIHGTFKRINPERTQFKNRAPFNITIAKGSVHIAASRGFAEFTVNNPKALTFLKWIRNTWVPDESYFSAINHNSHLGAPGAFRGPLDVMETKTVNVRFKQWIGNECDGKFVRAICIFNIRDLTRLASAKHLFANKFHLDYGQYAYDCLEELHWNRTINEYLYGQTFNVSYYSSLPHVKYRSNIQPNTTSSE